MEHPGAIEPPDEHDMWFETQRNFHLALLERFQRTETIGVQR